MTDPEEFELDGLSGFDLSEALVDLCGRGIVTCTRGEPGNDDATYAFAWVPLDNPEDYSPEVRERHAKNMRQLRWGAREH